LIDRTKLQNSFEFVAVAGARAKQLIKGARPRVSGPEKATKIAQQEVLTGEVKRIEPEASDQDQQRGVGSRAR
jgi:DNA-directed RNA polymerase subunit K/omega